LHCAPGAHQAIGTYPEGAVRISPGYFTRPEDIDRCVEALRDAAEPVGRSVGTRPSLLSH
jgi:selenocysteine lyase/cysteine desulfurase